MVDVPQPVAHGAPPREVSSEAEERRAIELVAAGRHADPHRVLGRHGTSLRCLRPNASAVRAVTGTVEEAGADSTLRRAVSELHLVHPGGVWEGEIAESVGAYHFEVDYPREEGVWTVRVDDAYRVWPTLGDLDLHL
jgi:1,4-alpha-glucan branching enzyme